MVTREPFRPVHDSILVMPKTQLTDPRADELLAVRCQLGEREAFDALIARWHEPLWRYLARLAGNDDAARDLAQDTWMRVFRGIARLREPAKLRSWLFGIARRVAMDRLRAQYARAPQTHVELDAIAADIPDVNLEEEFATLESGLATLPIIERETITLFYLRELSLEEIAGLLSVPVGTVKSRLFRARQMLRRALEGVES
jgi:RNA polymerase sigma factor (sigma-70 family)